LPLILEALKVRTLPLDGASAINIEELDQSLNPSRQEFVDYPPEHRHKFLAQILQGAGQTLALIIRRYPPNKDRQSTRIAREAKDAQL